ncbi:hypothetical protein P9112_011804 [Eukaryota sp. TZLM1-RC]
MIDESIDDLIDVPVLTMEEQPELLFKINDQMLHKFKKFKEFSKESQESSGFGGLKKVEEGQDTLEDVLFNLHDSSDEEITLENDKCRYSGLGLNKFRSQLIKKKYLDKIHQINAKDEQIRAAFLNKFNSLCTERIEKCYLIAQLKLRLTILGQEFFSCKEF